MDEGARRSRQLGLVPVLSLGRVLGVPLRLHASSLILPFVVLPIACLASGECWPGILILGASIVSIVLHELGHALVAQRLGSEPVDLTLYALGGVLRLRGRLRPSEEWRVAIAGPMVNALLALSAFALLASLGRVGALLDPSEAGLGVTALAGALWLNIVLFMFNLVPAYPMDGGRILKSRLAKRLGPDRALQVASVSGQAFGMAVLVMAPFAGSLWIAALALTLIAAARREARVEGREEREGRDDPIVDLAPQSAVVAAGRTLLEACRALETSGAPEIVVVDAEGRPLRRVSRHELCQALRSAGPEGPVEALAVLQDEIR